MEITYFGLSCFRIKHDEGVIFTDPFDPKEVGLSIPKQNADLILWSNVSEEDLSSFDSIKIENSEDRKEHGLDLIHVYEPGEYEVGGVFIRSINNPLFHVLSLDGIDVCYMGMVSKEIENDKLADLAELGNIDYLIVPVGEGGMFPDWKFVDKIIKKVDPSVVIPCSYRIDGMKGKYEHLKSVEEYLKESGIENAQRTKKLKLSKSSNDSDQQYQIVILETK